MVTPARSLMALSTRRLPLIERPRSPCSTCQSHLPYWTMKGSFEVIALAQRGERLRVGRPRAEQRPHRIAGREVDQREDAEGDDEQERHGDGQPPEDEADEIRARSPLRSEIAVEPGDRAPPGVQPVAALLEAVALARIDDELGRHAALEQRGVELLRLAERRAAVLARRAGSGSASSACRAAAAASGRARRRGCASRVSGPPLMKP